MITGEYWIEDGNLQYADGDVGDFNHEGIALQKISNDNLQNVYDYAKQLKLNLKNIYSYEEYAYESIQQILEAISEKLSNYKMSMAQVESKIKSECSLDDETYKVLIGRGIDPRLYVMKRYNWIAIRGQNVELYGLDARKTSNLLSGIDEILDLEHHDFDVNEDEIDFSIYDHKNNRSMNVTLKDMREGSLFKSFDILKSRSSEKLYPKTFKKYGIEGWRGTSEGFDFKNWFYKL